MALRNHKITIDGSPFVIRSDVEEARIREIEELINSDIEKIRGRSRKVPFTDALVLVLFKLADSLMDRQNRSHERLDAAARELKAIRTDMDEIQAMVTRKRESIEDTEA